MEKKEYKQPEIKVVEVEERILADSDPIVDPSTDETPDAKRGTFDFGTED